MHTILIRCGPSIPRIFVTLTCTYIVCEIDNQILHGNQTRREWGTGIRGLVRDKVGKSQVKNITFHGLAQPKLTWGSSNFVSDH